MGEREGSLRGGGGDDKINPTQTLNSRPQYYDLTGERRPSTKTTAHSSDAC